MEELNKKIEELEERALGRPKSERKAFRADIAALEQRKKAAQTAYRSHTTSCEGTPREKLFETIDKNRDGHVSQTELIKALRSEEGVAAKLGHRRSHPTTRLGFALAP